MSNVQTPPAGRSNIAAVVAFGGAVKPHVVRCSGRRLSRAARKLYAVTRANGGTAALEFALATPLLVALLVPVADLGLAYSEQIRVEQAAQAGAQYAVFHPWSTTSATAISKAVLAASTLSTITASPTPSQTCGCPSGTAIAATSCGSICADGLSAGYYVTVNAQAPYTSAMPYSLLGSSVILSAQSIVRIR
ncbi:MAG: TadE family protein [Stellaceae bacterium]